MAGRFKRVAVYCGGSGDAAPAYYEAARGIGRLLAERGVGVVYGGGRVGMMGAVAEGALAAGGEVVGVIPKRLMELELGHPGLTDLFVVDSMHARKSMMMHLADAYVALPGGFGTLEELFEAVTWAQLNYHLKPVGLLEVDGYWEHLLAFVDHATRVGFVRPQLRGLMLADADPVALLARMEVAEVPRLGSWLKP